MKKIQQYKKKYYQNASFVNVLAVTDALGIKIEQGAFVAKLYEFYKKNSSYSTILVYHPANLCIPMTHA